MINIAQIQTEKRINKVKFKLVVNKNKDNNNNPEKDVENNMNNKKWITLKEINLKIKLVKF